MTDDDRRSQEEELDRLRVDLGLKERHALELSAALGRRDQEVATLAAALTDARQRLAAQDADIAQLRATVTEARRQLEEVTGRAGYRLLARASAVLERHERLRRVTTGVTRRLSRRS